MIQEKPTEVGLNFARALRVKGGGRELSHAATSFRALVPSYPGKGAQSPAGEVKANSRLVIQLEDAAACLRVSNA
jgi:hypothetical protein